MVQTYKIMTGKDLVSNETWFKSATETGRPTRSAADPPNLRPQASRVKTRGQETFLIPTSDKGLE